ncbi:DUF5615 family PIN-like protein, partial [Planktothrix agardhii]|uniref:DUF5615 family PIN-like protein n=1 Tax=Planktothrix agardhii TaxID=1160 RepID=UPI00334227F0
MLPNSSRTVAAGSGRRTSLPRSERSSPGFLKLLIDEDAQDKVLVKLLRQAGHEVITVNEAGLMSHPDFIVLDYARNADRILLTLNCRDFQFLHAADSHHPGILAI